MRNIFFDQKPDQQDPQLLEPKQNPVLDFDEDNLEQFVVTLEAKKEELNHKYKSYKAQFEKDMSTFEKVANADHIFQSSGKKSSRSKIETESFIPSRLEMPILNAE